MFLTFKKQPHFLAVMALALFMALTVSPADAAELSPNLIKQYSSINPFSFILLEFGLIIILGVGGHILSRHYHMPQVLGELLIGIIAGNILYWLDWSPVFYMLMHMSDASEIFKSIWTSNLSVADTVNKLYLPDQPETREFVKRLSAVFTSNKSPALVLLGVALWIFSHFGVFLLLFKLGLKTKTEEIINAAEPLAFLVFATGTIVPFFLGLAASLWLLPEATAAVHVFIAAALCTTSSAITTGMFTYLNKHQSREAKLVINAAFLDDIFGMFFLSYIANIVLGETLNISEILTLFFYSAFIFVGIIVLGKSLVKYIPRFYNFDESHIRILIPLTVVVLVSWLADFFDIGVISGAFMAGMILNNLEDKRGLIKDLIVLLEKIFAPIFFVFVGMQVNLKQFVKPEIIWLTIVLLIAAVLGKAAAGFVTKQNINRFAIGLGMIPRGESALIFISIGKILGIINDAIFSVITVIVLATNFIAPWAINKFCAANWIDDSVVAKD
ncbi:MAG: cation:proton antiporter [Methylococcaceae bacterium]|jgi:Kef-type K+ transport system membrane component KefB